MRKENNTPHMGMIVALGVLIAAIWMLAIYDTIQEAHEEKYDVSVRPGAVSYGTHSSAMIHMVSAPARHISVPMISGGEIRSYARSGHASYAIHHTPYTIQTTSSATVHTVGSGGGASGGLSSASGNQGTSASRGIAYGGASVSMPTLALLPQTHVSAATTEEPAPMAMGPRRIKPNGDGEYHGEPNGSGQYWDEEEGTWTDLFVGAIKIEGGKVYQCTSVAPETWTYLYDQEDPGSPLGDAPWYWILLLTLGYGIAKMRLRKRIHG